MPLAPEQLPDEIKAIQIVSHDFPTVSQTACFDTAFHRLLPPKAYLFALPQNYEQKGVRRYGFHGLSCEYILQELAQEAGLQTANGRIIIAHLGGGTNLTPVVNGQSVDITMGLTPLGGLDTLIFTGGIDENATAVRQRICQEMAFMGIRLDPARNRANAATVSPEESPVTVRMMQKNEDLMIARHTFTLPKTQGV